MEASNTATHEHDPAVHRPDRLFRYSCWVHVGPGAQECPEAETGSCADAAHFHAWCRLPNQFQHREIREKAMSAKARRTRLLRDGDTDAAAILDDDLLALRLADEGRAILIGELLERDQARDYLEALGDVNDEPGEDGEPRWRHIEQDQRRLAELETLSDEQRPQEETAEAQAHIAAYYERLQARFEEIQAPRRLTLEEQPLDDLIDEARRERVKADAMEAFMHTYNTWEWYVGALRTPMGERSFRSLEAMQASSPEVIAALQETFDDLEQTQNRGRAGNS